MGSLLPPSRGCSTDHKGSSSTSCGVVRGQSQSLSDGDLGPLIAPVLVPGQRGPQNRHSKEI